jgi:hypothetical protein
VKVQIEIHIDEDDESIVMQKVSLLTKQAKEAGFNIGEIEFKRSRHNDNKNNCHKHQHHEHHI